MPGRGTVNRVVQIGVETVPGTGVPANKSLPTMSIELTRELTNKQYRSLGYKAVTATKITQDWCSGKLTGPLNYTEIVYPLATLVTPVITTPPSGILARQWLFTALAQGADANKTLTIQEGDATAASQAVNCILTQFGIDYKEDEATISGTILGQNLLTASLTGSPTAVALSPIGPREIDIYMDPIGGTIGTTKITDALTASFGLSNKQGPKWVLNTANPSYKETVELVPAMSGMIQTEHNAQSRAIYDAITASSNPYKLVRFKSTGPLIETVAGPLSYFYTVTVDFVAQVMATKQADAQGVWAYDYELVPEYHTTYGNKLWEITILTSLTAL